MKRKVFVISWFYAIGSFFILAVPIACIVIVGVFAEMPVAAMVAFTVFTSVFAVGFFIVFGKVLVQWVVVDEKGITARSLLSVIRRVTWDDVREVQFIRLSYIPNDPQMSWFMFVEKSGGEPYYKTAFNVKGKYIKIRASRKNREFLKQLRPDMEFNEFWGYFD